MTPGNTYGGGARPKHLHVRRRRYLVDRRRQLGATVRVAGLVLILLLALNAVIAFQTYTVATQITTTDPEVGERLRDAGIRNTAILGGISLIILGLVIVRSIVLTHRTHGAVINIAQSLEKVAEGKFEVELKLRSRDSLKALEKPFNEMTEMLRLQAKYDERELNKLADEVEEHGNPVDAEMLRRMAEARGKIS